MLNESSKAAPSLPFNDNEIKHFSDILVKNDYLSFLQKCFYTTNPATKFLPNWHLELIAKKLLACERGEIKRLIINMPPRYMKSICITVAWPAWLLGRNPARRIISASYSQQLALKHALDTRLIVNSNWYRQLFPKLVISPDQNEKNKFITTERGYRLATSVEGTLTGEGGNFLILDDPHNPVNIFSRKERESVINWYNQVFATRLDDKQNGVIVIVMQRLHAEDLCGFLHQSNSGNWHEVIIPAINNGIALHEARESYSYLQSLKAELGSYVFSAQYLQRPLAQEGGMIKPEWFHRYNEPPMHESIISITQSWDTAIKSGSSSDYSVCTTWAEVTGKGHFLLDVIRIKAEYPMLKRIIIEQAHKYQPETILMEDKASGQSLLQDLRQASALKSPLPLVPILPKFDKITRMAKASSMIEGGIVHIPARAINYPWLNDFEMELYTFPNSAHDDICDSLSQYLNWASAKKSRVKECIRSL
jgi:predicted phage terminase large subunit-like protein